MTYKPKLVGLNHIALEVAGGDQLGPRVVKALLLHSNDIVSAQLASPL
ncbi:hypothetical protein [Rhizobium sp. Root1203]|nr:hypothetical protein [Rhizobium sp. Root1203]